MLVAGEYYLVERKSVAKIMLLRECRVKIGLVTGYILVKAALFCYATIVSLLLDSQQGMGLVMGGTRVVLC